MNFGPQVNLTTAEEMVRGFLMAGYDKIDTAYVYNEGVSEEMLGKILPNLDRASFSIASKVNPRITGKLDFNAVISQCNTSLQRMNLGYIDVLYLHMPDSKTSIEESLSACAQLYQENKIKAIGLSNFPSWLVAQANEICAKNELVLPSVYQGLYNALSRNVERELFDCLRAYDMKFYAYNPLAGGLLTGKHLDFDKEPPMGRFSRLESYRKRYWKKEYFEAVKKINTICSESNITTAQAAYMWLCNHSKLKVQHNDAIIIGSSSLQQFKSNLDALCLGELPVEILLAFDEAFLMSTNESPEYFYFY